MIRDVRKTDGFTLLEVLVALVIAASASAVIFTHLRTLVDLNLRSAKQQMLATDTLNQSAGLLDPSWGARAALNQEDFQVEVTLGYEATPSLFVSNFDPRSDQVPPVSRAYTPYQLYRVQPADNRHAVLLLYPNLPFDR